MAFLFLKNIGNKKHLQCAWIYVTQVPKISKWVPLLHKINSTNVLFWVRKQQASYGSLRQKLGLLQRKIKEILDQS